MFKRRSLAVATAGLGLALTLGGCGGGDGAGDRKGDGAPPAPTRPPPEAADGTGTGACSDGACEILVTSTADITANGTSVQVTVSDGSVTFRSGGSLMQLGGEGGQAGFGNGLTAVVVAHDKDGAVLRFTTS